MLIRSCRDLGRPGRGPLVDAHRPEWRDGGHGDRGAGALWATGGGGIANRGAGPGRREGRSLAIAPRCGGTGVP